ncbi:MAG: hypothetical protein KHX55_07295 [Proteobacteria bacterium]|nr:hypothetical protein [Pseudomonadota bacterium]
MNSKRKFDLVCSLGGNCSAAHNLRYRKKRYHSLPFDWCYIVDEKPVYKLAECFKNDSFELIAQKDNLRSLTPEEEEKNVNHPDTIHYKDDWSNYYFVNHFYKTIENGGYTEFYKKFSKRIKRLLKEIDNSKNILFIISSPFEFNKNAVLELQNVLAEKYPNKCFSFELVEFNCKNNEISDENPNFTIRKIKRDLNDYDFLGTNFEWAFLDNIIVRNPNERKLVHIQKIKKGIKIVLLGAIPTLLRIKLFVFGIRFDFCFGKDKRIKFEEQ